MKKRSSERILAEALLHLSEHQDLDKITVKSIVEESGLSLQTFYNHFADKPALIEWVHNSYYIQLFDRMMTDKSYSFHQLISDYVAFYDAHKKFFLNALENTKGYESFINQVSQEATACMITYIKNKTGMKTIPVDIQIALRIQIYGHILVFRDRYSKFENISSEEYTKCIEAGIPENLKAILNNKIDESVHSSTN